MSKRGFLFIAGLGFLIVRNLPLCILMPLWSHGDEIAHFDYVLKLNKGHIPQPGDTIEPELFLLHKVHYDSRYITTTPFHIEKPRQLGLARFSYEAHHPPLSYMILAAFRKGFLLFKTPLMRQVRQMRIVSLLAAALGLTFLYLGLRRAKIQKTLYYVPLIFIPLLVKDMFFAISIDNFSFLFGSIAVAGAVQAVADPDARRGWVWMALGTILAIWVKITNAFILVLWFAVALFIRKKAGGKKAITQLLALFIIVLALSSPWYLYNSSRQDSAFASLSELPFDNTSKFVLNLASIHNYICTFLVTYFRGEFVWNGQHFAALSHKAQDFCFMTIPFIIFFLAILSLVFPVDKERRSVFRFLVLGGFLALAAFAVAQFTMAGGIIYHFRHAFAALYPVTFAFIAGWERLFSRKDLILAIPFLGLLIHQGMYTYALLSRVF